jgi:D-beta-D-heptose 7-phosphate kinase / D-beta-D-heptose 1-phosphate adenosyltransferase
MVATPKVVMIAGKFDAPGVGLHAGHLDHIAKAKALGGTVVAVTHRDDIVARCSGKQYCATPLSGRVGRLYHAGVDLVVISNDENGTCVSALKIIKPDIFAKGGDRTFDNMPVEELEICHKLKIKIMYGVGDLLASSSDMAKGGI